MKQLPDFSLIVAGKIGAKKGASGSKVGPSGTEVAAAAPVAAEQALTSGSSQRKNLRKKKKDVEARGEPNAEGNVEQTGAGGSSKKGGKKRKVGDPPTDDAPKKRMKKKDFTLPRPSSVCEEELQLWSLKLSPRLEPLMMKMRPSHYVCGGGRDGLLMKGLVEPSRMIGTSRRLRGNRQSPRDGEAACSTSLLLVLQRDPRPVCPDVPRKPRKMDLNLSSIVGFD